MVSSKSFWVWDMSRKPDDEKNGQSSARTLTEIFQAERLNLSGQLDNSIFAREQRLAKILEIENLEIKAMTGQDGNEDGTILIGGIPSKYKKPVDHRAFSKDGKKKDQALWNLIYQQTIENALKSINEMEAYHQERMEWFTRQLNEIRLLLEELSATGQALNQEQHFFTEFGKFNLNENGHFKNEKTEAALKAWEARTGKPVDRNNPACYLTLLEIGQDVEIQIGELEQTQAGHQQDYERHKANREEAGRIRDMLESDDPEQIELALEKMEHLQNDLRVEMTLAVPAGNLKLVNEQPEPGQIEMKEQARAQASFAFDFPPLHAAFDRATLNESPETGQTRSENPIAKKTPAPVPFKH
ncbi:MAG: hypothetical protein ACKV1O_16085 [Saprospiraceae bacterium]